MPTKNEPQKKEEKFNILIDRKQYTVYKEKLSGAELRQVPTPPIGPDRDLFEIIPGEPDDHKVENEEVVAISNGKRFFTVPTHINPGKTD